MLQPVPLVAAGDASSLAISIPIIVAAIGLLGVGLNVVQKHRNDSRNQWWSRVEWALNALDRSPEQRRIGTAVLDRLADTGSANDADRKLIEDVILATLEPYVDETGETRDDATGETSANTTSNTSTNTSATT